jgi:AraC-like DNA-binding protein
MLLSVQAGAGVAAQRIVAPGALASSHCHLLHARGRQHFWEGSGALSIKAFFSGRAQYEVGRGNYAVDESSYLVLNEGQRYSITVDARRSVESFCLFFASGMAEDVERNRTVAASRLIDAPAEFESGRIQFFERCYSREGALSPAMLRLRAGYEVHRNEPGWLLEQFHEMMELLLGVRDSTRREAQKLANVRVATREEIYRRVWRARDYACALLDQPITLGDLARVACLSPNHLLRCFRDAFGISPHQFLTGARLDAARRLLRTTELPVTDICLSVGFSSHGSFSWLFRRRFGRSPSEYRLQKR